MHFLIYFAVLSGIGMSAFAQNVNNTTPTQEFFLISQYQMQQNIAVLETKGDWVKIRGADHLKVYAEQHQVVLKEILRVQQSLVAMQSLSTNNRVCIRKYMGSLVTYPAAQQQFSACLSTASSRINSFASTYYLNQAKTTANINLPRAIASCNNTYANNATALENCVVSNVTSHLATVENHLNIVNKNLESNIATLTDITREENQCAFVVEKNSLKGMGTTLERIAQCVKDAESPLKCPCSSSNSTALQ